MKFRGSGALYSRSVLKNRAFTKIEIGEMREFSQLFRNHLFDCREILTIVGGSYYATFVFSKLFDLNSGKKDIGTFSKF